MINTKVWAHRGASAYAPENSLEAFELAIQMGAHGIELDIYETADSKLVIHHDNDIKRMTNGVEAKIQETDFDTLRTYNFNGKWGDKYGFVKIPTLHEVLDLFRPTDKNINIELKEGSRSLDKFKGSLEANASRVVPKWLEMSNNVAKVVAEPAREDIDLPIEEHLIVELYSK